MQPVVNPVEPSSDPISVLIASGEIKVDEAAQLQELYIIKLKRDICMLETNVKNFPDENKATVYLKQNPKEIISENKSKIIQSE